MADREHESSCTLEFTVFLVEESGNDGVIVIVTKCITQPVGGWAPVMIDDDSTVTISNSWGIFG